MSVHNFTRSKSQYTHTHSISIRMRLSNSTLLEIFARGGHDKEHCCAAGRPSNCCRVLLLQWQPSLFRIGVERGRHNRRIVCGQIPRPLSLLFGEREQQGRKKKSFVSHSHQKPTFPPRQPTKESGAISQNRWQQRFLLPPSSL